MAEDKNQTHYFLDESPDELKRLDLGQQVISSYMGKPVWAPIDFSKPGYKILDSACANAIWLEDLRASLPVPTDANEYMGTDITDVYFPEPAPEGIELTEQSMTKPWPTDWNRTFDLVHQRMALPGADKQSVRSALEGFVGLLKPGGWIQLVEPDHSIYKGSAMRDFYRLLCDIFEYMGTDSTYAVQLKGWFEEMGLQNVEEKVFDIPLGKSNTKLGPESAGMIQLTMNGLVMVAKTAKNFKTVLTQEELDSLPQRIHTECKEEGSMFRLHCVWGQRA